MLSLLDLFSGIGGFSLGMEATKRIKTVAFCEKDEFCRKVLKKHWSNTQQYIDIRDMDGTKISADIISGGFPCQSFSVAGKRKGTTDDRYLWPDMFRVITEVKPRWCVLENVSGIININNGLVLRQVQTDLESEGFQVQCFVIPASGIGAWHQRKRVWIIAYSNSRRSIGENKEIQARRITSDNGSKNVSNSNNTGDRTSKYETNEDRQKINERREGQSQFKSSGYGKDVSNSKSKRTWSDNSRLWQRSEGIDGRKSSNVSNSNKRNVETGCERQRKIRKEHKEERSSSDASGIRKTLSSSSSIGLSSKTNIKELERKRFSFKDNETSRRTRSSTTESWWTIESKLCGVPDGVSTEFYENRNNRIKALGNAIVPQIAFEIGKAIVAAEGQE
jgi:DNA (cytosine-5)-methyltransferase 1